MISPRFLEGSILVLSLATAVGVGAAVSAWHAPRENREVSILPGLRGQQIWHYLSPGCDCSRRLAERLKTHKPAPEWMERIAWRNPDGSWSAYRLDGQTDAMPVPAIGVRSVPWMLALNKDSKVIYAGGYGMRSSGEDALISAIARGESPSPLPVRGCTFAAGQSKAKQ